MNAMSPRLWAVLAEVGVATVAVAVATGIKAYLVDPVIDLKDPYALYIAVVAFTAWWGWRGAAFSIVLSALAANYFFIPPFHSLHVADPADRWLMVLFFAEAGLIAWLVARLIHAQRLAERAVSMRDRFVATVSHDLRSPLQTILAWAHALLADTTSDPGRQARALQAIQRAVEQQQRLIDDLLDLSVAAQGKLQIQRQAMELMPLVQASAEAWAPQCEQRGVILKIEGPANPLIVDLDPDRLRQVIANLLGNCLKFTRSGDSIRVEVVAGQDAAVIRVVDSGEGIDPAMLERIFEPWQQADHTQRGGVGLGLAITRHLVELHRGSIRAESAGKGRGAAFEIRLPRAS